MDIITWDETYSVGIDLLDQQHKKIVSIINQLITHNELDVRSEAISDLLSDLTQYAHNHFLTEEAVLEKFNYDSIDDQKKEHKEYRLKIVNFCMDTVDHKISVPQNLKEYIYHWWKDHILISDMAYKPFFENLIFDINEVVKEDFLNSIEIEDKQV